MMAYLHGFYRTNNFCWKEMADEHNAMFVSLKLKDYALVRWRMQGVKLTIDKE